MNLHPEHLQDLRKSGLKDEMIERQGIKTVIPAQINAELGFDMPGMISLLKFPYSDTHARYRVFGTNGSSPKYLQRRGSLNYLYFIDTVRAVLSDVSVPLYITEGEKKTCKAVQEGLACIGISGLWNWSNGEKKLLPDFDLIELKGRSIFIVPDNDLKLPNKHGYSKKIFLWQWMSSQRLSLREALR